MENLREKVVRVVKKKIFEENIEEMGEGKGYDNLKGNVWWLDIMGKRMIEKKWERGEKNVNEIGMKEREIEVIERKRKIIVREKGILIRERENGRMKMNNKMEEDNEIKR